MSSYYTPKNQSDVSDRDWDSNNENSYHDRNDENEELENSFDQTSRNISKIDSGLSSNPTPAYNSSHSKPFSETSDDNAKSSRPLYESMYVTERQSVTGSNDEIYEKRYRSPTHLASEYEENQSNKSEDDERVTDLQFPNYDDYAKNPHDPEYYNKPNSTSTLTRKQHHTTPAVHQIVNSEIYPNSHLQEQNKSKNALALPLVYPNETLIYFTECIIPDTTSDSIFIDTAARLITLKSPSTIQTQVWITTHRIVTKLFYGRDGDGSLDTQDEEDVLEVRSDDLLTNVSSITLSRESASRAIIHTPMLGWSSSSPVKRMLRQLVRIVELIVIYGPIPICILNGILFFAWLVSFSVSNNTLWAIFLGILAFMHILQKLISVIVIIIFSVYWIYWSRLQNQLGKPLQKKNELNKSNGPSSNENNDGSVNKTVDQKAKTSTPILISVPISKIIIFTLLGLISLAGSIIVFALLIVGNLVSLVIAFFIHFFISLLHATNLFVFIPDYTHNYPTVVKITFGDNSHGNDHLISLSSSDQQKTQFALFQILGCFSGCGIGVIYSFISYLRQTPRNYRSLRELQLPKNNVQYLFLSNQDAILLRNIISVIRENVRSYDEDPSYYEPNIPLNSTVPLKAGGSILYQHISHQIEKQNTSTPQSINRNIQRNESNSIRTDSLRNTNLLRDEYDSEDYEGETPKHKTYKPPHEMDSYQ